jgi:non-heme chloroperoxidase
VAHVFDDFAPKLSRDYHVYGITRRGFGASSAPVPDAANYSADRLGDDPDRIGGLIYLEADYEYAYYDASLGNEDIDSRELLKKLEQLEAANTLEDERQLIQGC